jgi:hypothetical protein
MKVEIRFVADGATVDEEVELKSVSSASGSKMLDAARDLLKKRAVEMGRDPRDFVLLRVRKP